MLFIDEVALKLSNAVQLLSVQFQQSLGCIFFVVLCLLISISGSFG